MSNSSSISLKIFRTVLLVGLFVTISPLYAEALYAGGADRTCAGAVPADLNSSLRTFNDKQGEPYLVKVEIPSAGILSVDVSAPGAASVEPKLGFPAAGCGYARPVVIERSATHLVLAARKPGSYVFRVSSQDPALVLGELKVRTGFVGSISTESPFDKAGEDEEELEAEADPLIFGGSAGQGEGRSLHSGLHELCRNGEVDDHGDSFTCATFLSLSRIIGGEIGNGWGDDADVFQFFVDGELGAKLRTVEIETTGDVDTFGTLHDRFGIRLDKAGEGGHGANFRIVRTLPPGVYYVRVEGRHGGEGAYGLRVVSR